MLGGPSFALLAPLLAGALQAIGDVLPSHFPVLRLAWPIYCWGVLTWFWGIVKKRRMRSCFLIFLLFATTALAQMSLPQEGLPVEVEAKFYLLSLSSLNEKAETFDADLYLQFSWKDQRLAHSEPEGVSFAEEGASEKLKEIWWPQIEFVNTSHPEITNTSLTIHPDGRAVLDYAVSATFRSNLNLKRFPFDEQTLDVRVQSFLYEAQNVVFKAPPGEAGFQASGHYEGFKISGVDAKVVLQEANGWIKDFSEYRAEIHLRRDSAFYIWTVFGPVVLIFMICCTIYLMASEELADRVGICLTTLLACIATQFTLSFTLPQISYITIVDRLFMVTYAFTALNVCIAALETFTGTPTMQKRLLLFFGIPLAYVAVIFAAILI